MQVDVHSKDVRLTRSLKRFVERKMQTALGRFDASVDWVKVQISDINGPRGGEDIRCRVLAHVSGGRTLAIDETKSEPFAAVAHAAERLGRSVARRVDRLKSGPRRR